MPRPQPTDEQKFWKKFTSWLSGQDKTETHWCLSYGYGRNKVTLPQDQQPEVNAPDDVMMDCYTQLVAMATDRKRDRQSAIQGYSALSSAGKSETKRAASAINAAIKSTSHAVAKKHVIDTYRLPKRLTNILGTSNDEIKQYVTNTLYGLEPRGEFALKNDDAPTSNSSAPVQQEPAEELENKMAQMNV